MIKKLTIPELNLVTAANGDSSSAYGAITMQQVLMFILDAPIKIATFIGIAYCAKLNELPTRNPTLNTILTGIAMWGTTKGIQELVSIMLYKLEIKKTKNKK